MRNNSKSGLILAGVSGGMHTSISDSVISGNGLNGLEVDGVPSSFGTSAGPSTAVVTRSVITNNQGAGLSALNNGRSFIAIGGSIISGNSVTWNGATVSSFGDNHVFANFDNDPAMTVISRK